MACYINSSHIMMYNEANSILQEYTVEVFDEHLDSFAESAVNIAQERYSDLHAAFSEVSDGFLEEIEKILLTLSEAVDFTNKWKATRINPEIDIRNLIETVPKQLLLAYSKCLLYVIGSPYSTKPTIIMRMFL